jgi:antitoxin FitA
VPTIHIRDIPDGAYEVIRRRARSKRTSIQGYLRERVLEMAEPPTKAEAVAAIEEALATGAVTTSPSDGEAVADTLRLGDDGRHLVDERDAHARFRASEFGPLSLLSRSARGCGAVGSAPPWHGGGQGFESPQLHKSAPWVVSWPALAISTTPSRPSLQHRSTGFQGTWGRAGFTVSPSGPSAHFRRKSFSGPPGQVRRRP